MRFLILHVEDEMKTRQSVMIVDNGVVRQINLEDKPGVNVSGADTILEQL